MSAKRIADLRKNLQAENLDGMIVSEASQLQYLTGYTGSNGLLVVTPKKALFFTDFRYTDQARKQVKGARCSIADNGDLVTNLSKVDGVNVKNRRYGLPFSYATVAERDRLAAILSDALIVNGDEAISDLGWVKDKDELKAIKKAVEISDIGFERILALVQPGIRERELAAELEYQMMMLGSTKPAFETIVASGYRSAMPHGIASDKKIKKGEFVTFDFGATYKGYVSDITRTVVVGKATSRQKKIYSLVLKSHLAGIRKVKAGVMARDVDAACRKIINKAGYKKNFGHGTGHGISIEVHSGPRVSPISDDKLKANNVITIEPGIYISGWGGVRIEDDVLVTRTGGKPLNSAVKKLLEL